MKNITAHVIYSYFSIVMFSFQLLAPIKNKPINFSFHKNIFLTPPISVNSWKN